MKRVTIKDVAAEAGVSFSAVSRAFQNEGKTSEATQKLVFEVAERLGYRPSPLARGLVRERSKLVTLVTGPTQSMFDALFFDGLAQALAHSGRHLMVASVHSEDEVESGLLQAMDYNSEAVIVSAGTMSLALSGRCAAAGVPVILSGRVLDAPGVDCVLAENVEGGNHAGSLLARVAPGPLAFFGQGGRTFADRERLEGFNDAIGAAEITVVDAGAGDNVRDAAMSLLGSKNRPRGVFCSNDGLAIELLQAALLLGLRVPEDLCLVGFDNIPMAAWPAFGLTTIDYPIASLIDAIMASIERDRTAAETAGRIERVQTRLIVRRTTPTGSASALRAPDQGKPADDEDHMAHRPSLARSP